MRPRLSFIRTLQFIFSPCFTFWVSAITSKPRPFQSSGFEDLICGSHTVLYAHHSRQHAQSSFITHIQISTCCSHRVDTVCVCVCVCVCVPPGLKTYLISGRKSDQLSACTCCQAGLCVPEHGAAPGCTSPRNHSPSGGPGAGSLPLERATVGAGLYAPGSTKLNMYVCTVCISVRLPVS